MTLFTRFLHRPRWTLPPEVDPTEPPPTPVRGKPADARGERGNPAGHVAPADEVDRLKRELVEHDPAGAGVDLDRLVHRHATTAALAAAAAGFVLGVSPTGRRWVGRSLGFALRQLLR